MILPLLYSQDGYPNYIGILAWASDKLRYHHENEVVEFKKAENSFSFDELGKYFSALSNEANLRDKDFAWLVFGVHDKTREILGTTYKNEMKSLQKLKYDLSQHTTDRNTFRDIYVWIMDHGSWIMDQGTVL